MRKNRTKFYNPDRSTLTKQPTQLIAVPLTGHSAIILKEKKRKDSSPREQILPKQQVQSIDFYESSFLNSSFSKKRKPASCSVDVI